jgi:hypothetical protein
MIKKVILICLSLMVSGCYDGSDAVQAIQLNLKVCFSKAETDTDKILCMEEAQSYRVACFNRNGYYNDSWSCDRLVDKSRQLGEQIQ